MARAPAQVSLPGLDGLYGLDLVELTQDRARAKLVARRELEQPLRALPTGLYAAVAESLASAATARAVASEDRVAEALALNTSFLQPIGEGPLDAVAVAKHRGRTTWVWEVELCDGAGRLCALARVTVAVRERAAG